jgi:tetratricopeptide (TPR) repeat protein
MNTKIQLLEKQADNVQQEKLYIKILLRTFILFIVVFLTLTVVLVIFNYRGITHGSWSDGTSIILILFSASLTMLLLVYFYHFPSHLHEQDLFDTPLRSSRRTGKILEQAVKPRMASEDLNENRIQYRGIQGTPPPTDPNVIVQRDKTVKEVYANLIEQDTSALILTGLGGIGKSTLAALTFRYAEKQRHNNSSIFQAPAIWMRLDCDVTMIDIAGTLFNIINKPMPDFTNLLPHNQAAVLLNALNSINSARLIILDQFESLLEWQKEPLGTATTHEQAEIPLVINSGISERPVILDPGISEWLAALNSQKCQCRVLITSRPWLQKIRAYPRTRMLEYVVNGLEECEGIELLRNQKVKGTEDELRIAVKHCEGHALSLTLLSPLLHRHNLTLSAVLNDSKYTRLWTGDIARNLLDTIYNEQLNDLGHLLLFAFSIYRLPVPLDGAQAVIEELSRSRRSHLESTLDTLLSHHLLQATGEGYYQPHSIVALYAREHAFQNTQSEHQQAIREAHARAAQYYYYNIKSSPSRIQRQNIQPLIEAVWHTCQAELWLDAYHLMEREDIFLRLKHHAGNTILLELYEMLFPLEKWNPTPAEVVNIYINLGRIYRTLGRRDKAQEYLKRAMYIAVESKDRTGEGTVHSFLGRVYADLGKKEEALDHLKQALEIRKAIGDREGESWTLDNLGRVYDDLGYPELARQYCEQALYIREEIGERRVIGRTLNTLGRIYSRLGNYEQARKYLEQALRICKEEGDIAGEALIVNRMGLISYALMEMDKAMNYFQHALSIRKKIGDRAGEGRTLNNLGSLYRELQNYEEAEQCLKEALLIAQEVEDCWIEERIYTSLGLLYLQQGDMGQALSHLEKALHICIEAGDLRGEGWVLHNFGRVYVDLARQEDALKYFKQALHIWKKVEDLKGQGWALYNIGLLYQKQAYYEAALACFMIAGDIFEKVQKPDSEQSQQAIDKLRMDIGEEPFSALLAKVKSEPSQIVDRVVR